MTDLPKTMATDIDRYAVVGNPVAHSKSPLIHAAFAEQTRQKLCYEAKLAPINGSFEQFITELKTQGYKGLNITVPFKFEALDFVFQHGSINARANQARAVNTIIFNGDGSIIGDNTDGIGLINDITKNLQFEIAHKKVLLLGSGGAAFGVLPLLSDAKPNLIVIANRTFANAEAAAKMLSELIGSQIAGGQNKTVCMAKRFDELGDLKFDLVINSTSIGLTDAILPIPDTVFGVNCLAYDMMYGRETAFIRQAGNAGAKVADGLGMLVEQAAEAFMLWRGVRPDTQAVINMLRAVT